MRQYDEQGNRAVHIRSIVVTFLRGMYVLAIVWVIAYLIWWPLVLVGERLIHWLPLIQSVMASSNLRIDMLRDIVWVMPQVLLAYFIIIISGTPVVTVTAAMLSIVVHVWPKPHGRWFSAIAGIVAAFLAAPISFLIIDMTAEGSSANLVILWQQFVLIGFPVGCLFGGYHIGKPLRNVAKANGTQR